MLLVVLLLVVGALPVVRALWRREVWGAAPTSGLLLGLFALWQLARRWKRRRAAPPGAQS